MQVVQIGGEHSGYEGSTPTARMCFWLQQQHPRHRAQTQTHPALHGVQLMQLALA